MGQTTLDGDDLGALRAEYDRLVNDAVAVADRMLREGRPTVARLNERSLRWRDELH
ncbi:MAG: hypothetical protein V5A31_12845 [Haloferacaceae archaeon]